MKLVKCYLDIRNIVLVAAAFHLYMNCVFLLSHPLGSGLGEDGERTCLVPNCFQVDFECILKTEISEANEQAEEECNEEDLADSHHNSVSIPHGRVGVSVHCQCV